MSKQTYKTRLIAVLELKSEGLNKLHQRVRLLVDVFEDSVFRADIGGDDFALAEVLDKHVDDTALTFLELRTVMQAYPNAIDWRGASLRQLLANAVAKSSESTEKPDKAPRRTVTIKEFERAQEKLKDAEFSVRTLTDELSELRAENKRLLAENARLEGRIVELERLATFYQKATSR